MQTVADIIDAFGGVVPFSKFFGRKRHTVHTWRRRNFIPAEMDVDLIKEAARRKIALTYEDLAVMRQPKKALSDAVDN